MKEPDGHQEMQTWTREELLGFLHFISDDRLFALYRLSAYSGMRRGELLGLRWVDVKFHHGSVSLQQQLGLADDEEDEDAGADTLVLAPVKTRASRRPIKLDAATLAVLREHRAAQEFERLIGRSGAKRIRFHDLRHTHATLLLEAHVDITVQPASGACQRPDHRGPVRPRHGAAPARRGRTIQRLRRWRPDHATCPPGST